MEGVGRGYGRRTDQLMPKGRGKRQPFAEYANDTSVSALFPLDETDQAILNEYFSGHKQVNDTMIVVEGVRIFVPRDMLIWCSDLFRDLIKSVNSYGSVRYCWTVDSYSFVEIFEMLKCLFSCPTPKRVDQLNVVTLLKLSSALGVKCLQSSCQEFLKNFVTNTSTSDSEFLFDCLNLAARFKLMEILTVCINKISLMDINMIRNKYLTLPDTLIALILDAKMGLVYQEMFTHGAQDQTPIRHHSMDDCAEGKEAFNAHASLPSDDSHCNLHSGVATSTPVHEILINDVLLNRIVSGV